MSSEQIKTPNFSHQALLAASENIGVDIDQLSVETVAGGFSLNKRAIFHGGDKSIFIKEVDDSVLEGDGQRERMWLAKDHGLMELLRSKGLEMVPRWSRLSDDSSVLMMPAYPSSKGWHWLLPNDVDMQHRYIQAVVEATRQLEEVTFTDEETERYSMQPYFRDKIGDVASYVDFTNDRGRLSQLTQKYQLLAASTQTSWTDLLRSTADIVHDASVLAVIQQGIKDLRGQPNEVFGHCDVRSDNIAYNFEEDQLVIVDWNWASQTPRKFGSTEFLISVAVQGADISDWHDDLSPELLDGVVGFWWRSCLEPNIGETSSLRNHQAMSAAVAYDLLTKIQG